MLFTGCVPANRSSYQAVWPQTAPDGPIDFEKHVKPLLEYNCLECHNTENAKQNAMLNLESGQLAFNTGRNPPVIRPGKPEESLLVRVLELDMNHAMAMPPVPEKLHGVRMEILKRWIAEGAQWPQDVRLISPQERARKAQHFGNPR